MPPKVPRIPSYRLHKPWGRAVITLGGRDIYLGPHGTPESGTTAWPPSGSRMGGSAARAGDEGQAG